MNLPQSEVALSRSMISTDSPDNMARRCAVILEVVAMSDGSKKPSRGLKERADEVLDSMTEAPEMEPGQADTTPAVPTKRGAKTSNTTSKKSSRMVKKPKNT
jgi:hypothetical protein